MILDILDKNDRYELLILKVLESKNEQFLTIEKLCEILEVSRYKFDSYVRDLNEQLAERDNSIVIQPDGTIIWQELTTNDLEYFRYVFAKRSLKFGLLHYIVEGNHSMREFAQKVSISLPQAYLLRKELDLFLNQFDISLEKMALKHPDEYVIRNTLFDIYFFFFNGYELPFKESLIKEVKELEQSLKASLNSRFSKVKLIKLRIFFSIQLCRVKTEYPLTKMNSQIINELSWNLLREQFDDYFVEFLNHLFEEAISSGEVTWTLLFIKLNVIENYSELSTLSQENQDIAIFKANFYQVAKEIMSEELPILTLKEHEERLIGIFLNWLVFSNNPMTFIEEYQVGYFQEMYPSFHEVSYQFVDRYCRDILATTMTPNQLVKYYYDLVFFLIKVIPLDEVEPSIYICVDFSHGDSYNEFIKRNIENYKDLNVKIQAVHDAKTDIYMSDFYLPKLVPREIIWRNPPTKNDWGHFADMVLKIKGEKSEKKE